MFRCPAHNRWATCGSSRPIPDPGSSCTSEPRMPSKQSSSPPLGPWCSADSPSTPQATSTLGVRVPADPNSDDVDRAAPFLDALAPVAVAVHRAAAERGEDGWPDRIWWRGRLGTSSRTGWRACTHPPRRTPSARPLSSGSRPPPVGWWRTSTQAGHRSRRSAMPLTHQRAFTGERPRSARFPHPKKAARLLVAVGEHFGCAALLNSSSVYLRVLQS